MSRNNEKAAKGTSLGFRIIILILCMLIVLSLAIIIYAGGIGDHVADPDNTDTVSFVVEEGATTSSIGNQLQEEKLIASADAFKLYSKYKRYDGRYQAGHYMLSPSMTVHEIAETLCSGKTTNTGFTIPEGYTEYDIAKKLSKESLVDKEEFTALLEDDSYRSEYSFLEGAQKGEHYLEGYLFPSTYQIPMDADADTIIRTMLDGYAEVFTDEYRARAKELGYTENEIIVIASIIEKEAAADQDRDKIASVIYNRLKIDMPLQMDSTVQYILGLEHKRKTDLLYSDTEIESPYNTYTNPGIPPGPICCPGKAAIEAALYPADTDYLYFILSDRLDDTMAFSKDYDQFLKDKDAYYEARGDE